MVNKTMIKKKVFINGKFFTSEKTLAILSPIDGKKIGEVPSLTSNDIQKVFTAAATAFLRWKKTKFSERELLVKSFLNIFKKKRTEFVNLLIQEAAKPKKASESEFDRTIQFIELTLEEAKRITGPVFFGDKWGAQHKLAFQFFDPLGVVLAISPYNFPLNLAIAKIIPALLMGNCVVFKPASLTPLIGCLIGEIIAAAKFPNGVFNIITGRGSEIGDEIIRNDKIALINFTGSSVIGKRIKSLTKANNVILELGGKDPAIILDDINDIDHVVSEIIYGAFSYSGQRCTAIKRVIMTRKMGHLIKPLLIKKIKQLKIGLPQDNADITPIVDVNNVKNVMDMITDAKKFGAKILIGGKNTGNLIFPTLIDDVKPEMRIATEEPFAPILPIIYVDNFEPNYKNSKPENIDTIQKMLAIANSSNYGLQASLFGSDINTLLYMAEHLEVGTVNINGQSQRGPDIFPFKGIKDSGMGTQGIIDTLKACCESKLIVINR